jgi:hypothetical protein
LGIDDAPKVVFSGSPSRCTGGAGLLEEVLCAPRLLVPIGCRSGPGREHDEG